MPDSNSAPSGPAVSGPAPSSGLEGGRRVSNSPSSSSHGQESSQSPTPVNTAPPAPASNQAPEPAQIQERAPAGSSMPYARWEHDNSAAMNEQFRSNSAPPEPVSKAGLDRQKEERDAPPEPTLKPKPRTLDQGSDQPELAPIQTPTAQQIMDREAEITYMEERLAAQNHRARDAFKTANVVPAPDPVSRMEADKHQTRLHYIEKRLASRKDRARNHFNRSR
jgi:hypothetical protein